MRGQTFYCFKLLSVAQLSYVKVGEWLPGAQWQNGISTDRKRRRLNGDE